MGSPGTICGELSKKLKNGLKTMDTLQLLSALKDCLELKKLQFSVTFRTLFKHLVKVSEADQGTI